jgi:hypothetical protein
LSQNWMRDYEMPPKNENLLTLLLLRQALERAGLKNLVEDVDTLLDAIRQMQFLNSEPETNPIKEQWLKIELPVAIPDPQSGGQNPGQSSPVNARIHIAYLPDGERQIDPEHTRCVIRVELALNDTVQVDVTIADHRAGVQVATSTQNLLERAKAELPGLKSGLETLGYSVQSAQCRVEEFSPLEEIDRSSAWNRFFEVRAEV